MKRVAIIGTGIAGLGCAQDLHDQVELTLYEKNDYVGGHTHTVVVNEGASQIPIDTGFMVYNETTYPQLTQLFSKLSVPTQATSMSFSVQHTESGLEFAGTGWNGLFAQRRNCLSPRHWRLLAEIDRFNSSCAEVLTDADLGALTLGAYCRLRKFSDDFRDRYLIPMSAAVWSAPSTVMLEFPAITLVRFFTHHRFLSLNGQLSWRTVSGGSQAYRERLIRPFKNNIHVSRRATSVQVTATGVAIRDVSGTTQEYDLAVIATHADEALQLLAQPSQPQADLLGKFRYQKNRATLHTHAGIMPRAKAAWASWNYRLEAKGASTIYWMNQLQALPSQTPYFVSINDPGRLPPDSVVREIDYDHPIFTLEAIAAQPRLPTLNQDGPLVFCGSYFKYGFHEDALNAGLAAAQAVRNRGLSA